MYQILKRQQYGRCTKNKSHYYPNKLYYNETVNLKQRYEHPITTIQFDGVKSREQRLASVTLHDGLITISKPSPSSTSNMPQYFNSKNENVLTSWVGHDNSIFDCSWYNNGRCLATASSDGICKLWDVTTKNELASFASPKQNLILSFKTIRPCSGNENLFVTSGRDGSIFMWDCRQRASHSLQHSYSQTKIICKKPVRHIANGHAVYTNAAGNNSSNSSNRRRNQFKSLFSANSLTLQNGVSNAIFGNHDGTNVLSSGSSDGLIKIWDMRKIYTTSFSSNNSNHASIGNNSSSSSSSIKKKRRKYNSSENRPPTPLTIIQEPSVFPFTNNKKNWLGSNSTFLDSKSINENIVNKFNLKNQGNKKNNFISSNERNININSYYYRNINMNNNNNSRTNSNSISTIRKLPLNNKSNFQRKNHGIASIDIDPTYTKLLVSYLNQSIHVYDLAGCMENNYPTKYDGYSYCCKSYFIKSSWTSDGKYILSGSSNGMGYLWKDHSSSTLSKFDYDDVNDNSKKLVIKPSFIFPICDSENDDVTNVVTPKTGNSITDLSFVATASISSSNTSLHQIKFWDLYNSEYEVDLNTTVRKDHQGINGVSSSETRKRKKRGV